MTSDDQSGTSEPTNAPLYCARCGTVSEGPARFCPACGAALPQPAANDVTSLAYLLSGLRRLHVDGALPDTAYTELRAHYETDLDRARAAGAFGPVAAPPTPAPAPTSARGQKGHGRGPGFSLGRLLDGGERTGESGAVASPPVQAPPKPPGPTLGQWAAARQADLVLYLGAFLLAIASFIFLQASGDTVAGVVRFGVLVGYTVGCLALGVLLPRWERVREAGPVFLALGALLVPVDFLALRVQVLGGDALPDDALWLIGGVVTAALYLTLAARGFGRFYAVPGGIAATAAWFALQAVLNLPEEWMGAWALLGAALVTGGAALRRARFAPPLVLGAAVLGAVGLLMATVIGFSTDQDRLQFPVAALLATATAALMVYAWRWPLAKAALPPLAAYAALAGWWYAAGFRGEWLGAFIALAGLGYLVLAHLDGDRRARVWAGIAALSGGLALMAVFGTSTNEYADLMRGSLPVTLALVLAGVGGAAWRWRWPEPFLALPALAALLGGGTLWALGVGEVWWAYPGLAAVLLILVAEPWWRTRPVLERAGWPYALGGALVSLLPFLPAHAEQPAHGMAASAAVAGIYLYAALRSRGALARLLGVETAGAATFERLALARVSGLLLYAAAAHFNNWAGLTGVDRAWVYAGLGLAEWAGLALAGRSGRELFGVLAPGGVLALALAAVIAEPDAGRCALMLALGALGPALAFPRTRRWPLWGVAAGFGVAALAAVWRWQGWDWPLLPLAYAGIALALCAALTPLRRYAWGERALTVAVLSWGPWLVAVGAAWVLLQNRADEFRRAVPLVRTDEWVVFTATAAASALAVTVEGLRLRSRWLVVSGTLGLLAAVLLAIAVTKPANVQAYTVPAGLYFIGLGLSYRRSPELLGVHLFAHEAVQILGMLVLLLPPAEQGLSRDGALYGLETIGLGLALLLAGLVLGARWLAAGGVAALSAVGLRWLFTSGQVPYWLTLGLVGMALLGVGLLLLLNREWWDSVRSRMGRWWLAAPGAPEPTSRGV